MTKIAVIGAGSWGTAIAFVLADNGHECTLWARRTAQSQEIMNQHTNESYLPGVALPLNLKATSNLREAVEKAEVLVFAVPTVGLREVSREVGSYLKNPLPMIHVSKGIEPDSLKRISELINEELPASYRQPIVALSGPSHAEEVVLRHPTSITAASESEEAAQLAQDLFMNHYFRIYTNSDLIGVEIGAALKNVIALGAGISDGLGFGDNAKAALITRGLAEITRLGTALGANPQTFSGLAGLGDLIVTCTSVHSRNWNAGNRLGQGQSLEEVTKGMGMVIEGVRTTKAAHQLAAKYQVSMPITEALYTILFEGASPQQSVEQLMGRMKKTELE